MKKALTAIAPIFDNFPNPIWATDHTGRAVYFNPCWLSLTGRTFGEEEGFSWMNYIHFDERPQFEKFFQTQIENKTAFKMDIRLLSKDGQAKCLSLHGSPLIGYDGRYAGHVCSCIDQTQLHDVEVQNLEMNKTILLSARLSAVGTLAAGMAHEINNPLTVISGKAREFLKKVNSGVLDPVQVAIGMDKILEMTGRISHVVSTLNRFTHETTKSPMQLYEVKNLVEEALAFTQTRFKNHGIEFRVNANFNDRKLKCRPADLMQALINLLNNAHDAVYGKSNPWIELSINSNTDLVEFSVMDSGAGIPLQYQDKVLDPFFTTKDPGKGIGMGLSLCHSIVKAHRGKLVFDSTSPHTRVIMSLPYNL